MKSAMPAALVSALTFLAAGPVSATNEYSTLLKTYKYAEAERVASARLAQDAANVDALVAKSEAILATGAATRLEEAVALGERCVGAHPQASACHLALGNALGSKAINAGIMSAIGYAGTIRDAFRKAVELDPQNIDARFSLLQYYQQAPAIVGGGSGKARALAEQTAAVNPEAARLMMARLDMAEDQVARAEAAALAARPGANEMVADAQRDLLVAIGTRYLADKKHADAARVLREAQKRFPDSEWAHYGMARLDQEQGRHAEAIAGFERVLALSGRPQAHYRIGMSWAALKDKNKALAAFERALASKTLSRKLRTEVEEQLKTVRG